MKCEIFKYHHLAMSLYHEFDNSALNILTVTFPVRAPKSNLSKKKEKRKRKDTTGLVVRSLFSCERVEYINLQCGAVSHTAHARNQCNRFLTG